MQVVKICLGCGKEFRVSPSIAHRRKNCSYKCAHPKGFCNNTGRTHFKKGIIPWSTGGGYKNPKLSKIMKDLWADGKFENRKIDYKDTAKKISAVQQGISIEDWKGFISTEDRRLRNSAKYSIWRSACMLRDDFTCQECGERGCFLEVHHIKSWRDYPELRFNINNGITYCKECHIKIDPYRKGRTKLKMEEQHERNKICC